MIFLELVQLSELKEKWKNSSNISISEDLKQCIKNNKEEIIDEKYQIYKINVVKDMLPSDKIFDNKNLTIEENNDKNKLLVLISDTYGYNFLNKHSNGERDDIHEDSDFSIKDVRELEKNTKPLLCK